jgi:hypothetical protein
MYQSDGEWHDLPSGNYYFSVEGVYGGVGQLVSRDSVVGT